MGEMRTVYESLLQIQNGRDHLGDPGAGGEILLKCVNERGWEGVDEDGDQSVFICCNES
jgi:hypothetical protein